MSYHNRIGVMELQNDDGPISITTTDEQKNVLSEQISCIVLRAATRFVGATYLVPMRGGVKCIQGRIRSPLKEWQFFFSR